MGFLEVLYADKQEGFIRNWHDFIMVVWWGEMAHDAIWLCKCYLFEMISDF